MRHSILISQEGVENRRNIILKRGEREEWAWLDPDIQEKRLVINKKNMSMSKDIENDSVSVSDLSSVRSTVREYKWKWSKSFDISEVGILSLQLRKVGSSTKVRNTIKIVKIIKKKIKDTMFVVFSDEDLQAPYYKVINDTSNMAVRFVQEGISYDEYSQKVLPKTSTPYAFNDPELP